MLRRCDDCMFSYDAYGRRMSRTSHFHVSMGVVKLYQDPWQEFFYGHEKLRGVGLTLRASHNDEIGFCGRIWVVLRPSVSRCTPCAVVHVQPLCGRGLTRWVCVVSDAWNDVMSWHGVTSWHGHKLLGVSLGLGCHHGMVTRGVTLDHPEESQDSGRCNKAC